MASAETVWSRSAGRKDPGGDRRPDGFYAGRRPRAGSRVKPGYRPTAVPLSVVPPPVVQAVGPFLPELNASGRQEKSLPVRRRWNLPPFESLRQSVELVQQRLPAGQ